MTQSSTPQGAYKKSELLRLRLVAIKEQQRLNAAKLKKIARSK